MMMAMLMLMLVLDLMVMLLLLLLLLHSLPLVVAPHAPLVTLPLELSYIATGASCAFHVSLFLEARSLDNLSATSGKLIPFPLLVSSRSASCSRQSQMWCTVWQQH